MNARSTSAAQRDGAAAFNLTIEHLNRDELKVHAALCSATEPLGVGELASCCFRLRPNKYVAGYRTRNALRRLVREQLIVRVSRGRYCASSNVEPDDAGAGEQG